jgi:protein AFG1
VPWTALMDEPLDGVATHDDTRYFAEGVDERSSGMHAVYGENEEERLSYARVRSRLREMGTAEYLTSNHTLFVVDDFQLGALL